MQSLARAASTRTQPAELEPVCTGISTVLQHASRWPGRLCGAAEGLPTSGGQAGGLVSGVAGRQPGGVPGQGSRTGCWAAGPGGGNTFHPQSARAAAWAAQLPQPAVCNCGVPPDTAVSFSTCHSGLHHCAPLVQGCVLAVRLLSCHYCSRVTVGSPCHCFVQKMHLGFADMKGGHRLANLCSGVEVFAPVVTAK